MARSRKYKGSAKQRQARSATRKAISSLKKKGLLRTKSTLPGKRPGGSVYSALKKLRPVVEGKASVLKAPKQTRRMYKGQFQQRHNKIIIPKIPGEKPPRISKKTGLIARPIERGGRKFTSYTLPRAANEKDIPTGKNITYSISMRNWQSKARFVRKTDLLEFLRQYDLKNHMDAIEIVVGHRQPDDEAA